MHRQGDDRLRKGGRRAVATIIISGLVLTGCQSPSPPTTNGLDHEAPAVIGQADANGVRSVRLTRQAIDRLGIETAEVSAAATGSSPRGTRRTVVPYSAVLYTPDGLTWVYTVPRPLTHVREKVVVATVGGADGTEAVLSEGPPVGTTVVTLGVVELYGAELGVGK